MKKKNLLELLKDWKHTRKLVGVALVVPAFWILTPPYFLPSEIEFYSVIVLAPLIGFGAVVLPFVLAAIALPVGLVLLGLPLNRRGVKRALKVRRR